MQKEWCRSMVLLGLTLIGTSPAGAQEAAGVAEGSEPVASEASVEATSSSPEEPAPSSQDERDEDPMGWFGIGLKLGVGGAGESSEFEVEGVKLKAPSRSGFQLGLPINLGGDGFGWIFEPYLNFDSDVTAVGLYNGPTFNFHVIDPLYVGFGFGPKLAYWLNADFADYGADIAVRVPITATYYVIDDLAALFEVGLGYGLSGYASKPRITIDPVTMAPVEEDLGIGFGSAFVWDVSAGVRWP